MHGSQCIKGVYHSVNYDLITSMLTGEIVDLKLTVSTLVREIDTMNTTVGKKRSRFCHTNSHAWTDPWWVSCRQADAHARAFLHKERICDRLYQKLHLQ